MSSLKELLTPGQQQTDSPEQRGALQGVIDASHTRIAETLTWTERRFSPQKDLRFYASYFILPEHAVLLQISTLNPYRSQVNITINGRQYTGEGIGWQFRLHAFGVAKDPGEYGDNVYDYSPSQLHFLAAKISVATRLQPGQASLYHQAETMEVMLRYQLAKQKKLIADRDR